MLNLAPLVAGQQEYYLSLAKADDYYLGKAEAPGVWIGSGTAHLELDGLVDEDDLRALLSLRDPRTGIRLNRARMPGYDIAFRPPKSVSLLFGLGERGRVTGEVVVAHDEAVRQAIAYLEAHACAIRYRIDGEVTAVNATGFVAAAFRHRTSRAADPLLHTHVLVANVAQDASGCWGALDGTQLFHHSLTAGYVYQAVLRAELTRRFGVEWEPVVKGKADIVGIPRGLIDVFAKRREAIERTLASRGTSSAKAAQVAALDTRDPKDHPLDEAELRGAWVREAEAFGFAEREIASLVATAGVRRRAPELPDNDALFSFFASPDGLTHRRSTFDRRDVVRAVCEALPEGADLATIENLADEFLLHREVVPLGLAGEEAIRRKDGQTVRTTGERFTTWEMLATEAALLERAREHQRAGVGLVDPRTVEATLDLHSSLSDEQRVVVEKVCGSGAGVDVVVGLAGSGKTFALRAAKEAWEASGCGVVGCSLSARAAVELQQGSGIASTTLARLLNRLDRRPLPLGTVVVVDEAAMVGTRDLVRLLDRAISSRSKLLLVGDHGQLPEMEAGGAFAALAVELGAAELVENRRQLDLWERQALGRFRGGDVVIGTNAYWRRGRLSLSETGAGAKEAMVEAWWQARQLGERVAMVALRRQDVRDLNLLARERLDRDGRLGERRLSVGSFEVAVGDEVVALRNDYDLGVLNGDRGSVLAINRRGSHFVLSCERTGGAVRIPRRYVEAGHVAHGYAMTIHKAQGATYDRCLVLVDEGLYRQAGYTALSRGRAGNAMFAVLDPDDVEHSRAPEPTEEWDGVRQVMRRLIKDRSQSMAVDQASPDDEQVERIRAALDRLQAPAKSPEVSGPDLPGLGLSL